MKISFARLDANSNLGEFQFEGTQNSVDFRAHLHNSLGEASVLLAVIGTEWVGVGDDQSQRRIDDPQDFVRSEIEFALGQEMPIIPVLVRGAKMPSESDLPPNLCQLSSRNAATVRSGQDFEMHVRRLIQAMEQHVGSEAASHGIRLCSTPESAARGEMSATAIAETIVAVTVAVWLAIDFQTVTHIVVGACIAPFLLLRTEYSTTLAISWFEEGRWGEYIVDWLIAVVAGVFTRSYEPLRPAVPKLPWLVCLVGAVPAGICLLVFFPACRVAAILTAMSRRPLDCLRAIPFNWRRLVLATDSCHPPEILPGVETIQPDSYFLEVTRFRTFATSNPLKSELLQLFHGSVVWMMALVLFVPAVVYRLSIKSTCVVYVPFLWIVRTHMSGDVTVDECLEDNRHGAIERLQRWYAVLILAITVGSIALVESRSPLIQQAMQSPGDIVACLRDLYLPTEGADIRFRSWHVARLLNAGIVIILFFYADRAARRLASRRWSASQVRRNLEICAATQVLLTLFTTLCTLGRFTQLAIHVQTL